MSKTAILFSGQGSQYPEMCGELLSLFPQLEKIFEVASDILGYNLKDRCLNSTAEELSLTQNAQPAILAHSILAFEAVKSLGISANMVAGHSLGEYAAMVASGIISVEDAFKVIKLRAAAMGKCAENQNGGMCAVIGIAADEIASICKRIDGYVLPVNFNSPVQTVIAGEAKAVKIAAEIFAAEGHRVMQLAVSAAFHSKLMQPAADEFKAAIKGVEFKTPNVDFYSNLKGELLTDFSDMPSYLANHLVSPVRFTDELTAMKKAGADRFIECGPNKVLSGLVKKTLSDVDIFNVENEKTFLKLKESL